MGRPPFDHPQEALRDAAQGRLAPGRRPWFKMNERSKRVEWLHLKESFADSSSKVWELSTLEQTSTMEVPNIEGDFVAGLARPLPRLKDGTISAGTTPAGTPKAKATGTDKGKPAADDPEKERKKAQDKLFSKLRQMKSKWSAVTSGASNVEELISTSTQWAWANNPYMLEGLQKAATTHHESIFPHNSTMTPWVSRAMV